MDQWIEHISEEFGTAVYGFDDTSLPKELSKLISDNNIQIGFAESCTGGYLSHLITLIPGASQYFRGSIIAYSYELKTQLCGVLPNTLDLMEARQKNQLELSGSQLAMKLM